MPAPLDPHQLPARTNASYHVDVATVAASGNKEDASRDCGVNGLARVASVPGTDMVRSFPFDLMHLLFGNLVKVSNLKPVQRNTLTFAVSEPHPHLARGVQGVHRRLGHERRVVGGN